MKKTSSQKMQDITNLLQQGYSCRHIQSITGVSKTTISRVNKTYEGDKENNKGGRPSKLSPADERRIINKITTGQLDNAVQATHFINNIIQDPVNPQTVRNSLKKAELWERVEVEWNKITPEECQNLIESLPRGLEAVYKAKGGHTKY